VVRAEWSELGLLGRTVLGALATFGIVAALLAVTIPQQVERHLIDAHIRSLSRIAEGMVDLGLIPPHPDDPYSLAPLDTAIRIDLLGTDTVRVKIWLPDGTIGYSDERALIGRSFPLEEELADAFAGHPRTARPVLEREENVFERGLPPLREYYIPAVDAEGKVVAVFEVYQLAEPVDGFVGGVRRYVWVAVWLGIGLLAVFIVVILVVNGRAAARRRRQAEQMFGDLVRAQAEERRQIIGALHDDIGQTLYRIHFGVEELQARVGPESEVGEELGRLGQLVNDVDGVLRAELRSLHYGSGEELSLRSALEELGEVTEMETDLDVEIRVAEDGPLSVPSRVALFRAAREGIMNVRKHAAATRMWIRVGRKGDMVQVDIADDGVGIRGAPGLGLTTTRERLEAMGGGLRVRQRRGGGTRFSAWIPVSSGEDRP